MKQAPGVDVFVDRDLQDIVASADAADVASLTKLLSWRRMHALHSLIQADFTAVFLEPDVVFTKNPLQLFHDMLVDADVVATSDYGIGAKAPRVNTKVIFAKPSDEAKQLIDVWQRAEGAYKGDDNERGFLLNEILPNSDKMAAAIHVLDQNTVSNYLTHHPGGNPTMITGTGCDDVNYKLNWMDQIVRTVLPGGTRRDPAHRLRDCAERMRLDDAHLGAEGARGEARGNRENLSPEEGWVAETRREGQSARVVSGGGGRTDWSARRRARTIRRDEQYHTTVEYNACGPVGFSGFRPELFETFARRLTLTRPATVSVYSFVDCWTPTRARRERRRRHDRERPVAPRAVSVSVSVSVRARLRALSRRPGPRASRRRRRRGLPLHSDGGARFAPRLLGVGVTSPPVPPSPPSVSGLGDASLAKVVRFRRDASEGGPRAPLRRLVSPARASFSPLSAGSSFGVFAPFAPFASPFPARAVLVADGRAGSSTAAAAASSDGAMFAPEETLHEMLQKSLASACSVLWQWRHARARAAPRPLADPPFPRGCGRSERETPRGRC